jgi:hypothetical protein
VRGHVRSHCIGDSNQGRRFNPLVKVHIHVESSLLVFEHSDRRKGSCLGLCCILSLCDYVITITAITQPNNTVDCSLEQLYLL